MKFSVAAVATLAAGAAAWTPAGNATLPKYTTEVVTAYTTYCPEPTSIVHAGKTYTVTKATTLTITNCPCTITKPIPSAPPVYTSPAAPVKPPVVSPAPPKNGTVPAAPTKYTTYSVASPSASKPAQFTGGANKAVAASGAGLAAVFGFAAYLL